MIINAMDGQLTEDLMIEAVDMRHTHPNRSELDSFGSVINATYAQLSSMITTNTLVPGCLYRLTDYITKYRQPYTKKIQYAHGENDVENNGEPLILRAVSNNSFSPIVFSEKYPRDIIYYDFFDNVCENNTTPRPGFITRRIFNGIDVPHDWRSMLWARFKVNPDSVTTLTPFMEIKKHQLYKLDDLLLIGKEYVSKIEDWENFVDEVVHQNTNLLYRPVDILGKVDDYLFHFPVRPVTPETHGNGNRLGSWTGFTCDLDDYAERYTFNFDRDRSKKEPTLSDIEKWLGTEVVKIPQNSHHRRLHNNVFAGIPTVVDAKIGFRDNTVYGRQRPMSDSYSNGIPHGISDVPGPDGSAMSLQWLSVGINCSGNIFLGYLFNNEIGDNFRNNILLRVMNHCKIGQNCEGNLIYGNPDRTIFGDNFRMNSVGWLEKFTFDNQTINNVIKQGHQNRIGPNFMENVIHHDFNDNDIGSSCAGTRFGSTFIGNSIGANFKDGHLQNNVLFCRFGNGISNLRSGSDVRHIEVGNGSSDINLGANVENNYIGNGCTNVAFVADSYDNYIGNGNDSVSISSNTAKNRIGNGNRNISISSDSRENQIGNANAYIHLLGNTMKNRVENGCINVAFLHGAHKNTVDSGSGEVYFGKGCRFDENGHLRQEMPTSGAVVGNAVGNDCREIYFNGSTMNNKVETGSKNITIDALASFNTVEVGCVEVTIGEQCLRNRIRSQSTGIVIGQQSLDNEVAGHNNHLGRFCQDNRIARKYSGVTLQDGTSRLLIGFGSNPNLLDNGYFKNAVNQRNVGELRNDSGHIISRWYFNGIGQAAVYDNCLSVLNYGESETVNNTFQLTQSIELPKRFYGKDVALSIKSIIGSIGKGGVSEDGAINTLITGSISSIGKRIRFVSEQFNDTGNIESAKWVNEAGVDTLIVTLQQSTVEDVRNWETWYVPQYRYRHYTQEEIQQLVDDAAGEDVSRRLTVKILNAFSIMEGQTVEVGLVENLRVMAKDFFIPATGDFTHRTRGIDNTNFLGAIIRNGNHLAVGIINEKDFDEMLYLHSITLEIGRYSTVYDESPPKPDDVLRRCQRFCQIIEPDTLHVSAFLFDADYIDFSISLNVPMRVPPVTEGDWGFVVRDSRGNEHDGFEFSLLVKTASNVSSIVVRATKEAHGMSDGFLCVNNRHVFSADL